MVSVDIKVMDISYVISANVECLKQCRKTCCITFECNDR
jgi:hypothetical protein